MQKLKRIGKFIFKHLKNKYILTTLIFIIWLLFLDNNNLLDRFDYIHEYNQLKSDQEYYLEKIKNDAKRMEELRTDKENLEKFAREQYLMKKENEDIFIFVEEE